jgi:hypothetical protein
MRLAMPKALSRLEGRRNGQPRKVGAKLNWCKRFLGKTIVAHSVDVRRCLQMVTGWRTVCLQGLRDEGWS